MKRDFIFIKIARNSYKRIYLDEIIYCKADRAYCNIKTHNKEFTFSKPLSSLEEQLKQSINFIRIKRSYIVNIDNCIEFNNSNTPELLLVTGEKLKPSIDCIKLIERLFKISNSETEIGVLGN